MSWAGRVSKGALAGTGGRGGGSLGGKGTTTTTTSTGESGGGGGGGLGGRGGNTIATGSGVVAVATSGGTSGGGGGARGGGGSTGRGRGRVGGERGRPTGPTRPNPDFLVNQADSCDIVQSRPSPDSFTTKQGDSGKQVPLTTNFYSLDKLTNFNLFHYHLDFKPEEERTEVKKKLVQIHENTLGAFIFDGQSLYTPHRIMLSPMELYSMNTHNNKKVQISLKLVSEVSPVEPLFLQVYNIILRNIMVYLDLELMGRFYFDPTRKVVVPSRKLEMWPGYITSVRNHENQILLNMEVAHRVVRSDTVLDFVNNAKAARSDYKKEVTKQLLGSIVLTRYNKKNYRIDDIKWDVSPSDVFPIKGGQKKSYLEYYKEQYGSIIKDAGQPMLVSLPKKKDYHRGANQPIYLVPELCQMTGLTEAMRKDVNLMKDLAKHLTLSPKERIQESNDFISRWYKDKKVVKELERWNIGINRKPVPCMGRVVDMDDIVVGPKASPGALPKTEKNCGGEWTNVFKSKPMLTTVPLRQWVLILPQKSDAAAEQIVSALRSTSKAMSFQIDNPTIMFRMNDSKPGSYSTAIQNIFTQLKGKVQLFFVILPNNNGEVYSAIKKKCCVELGVSSQCVILKTLLTKNSVSISGRLAIQMNAKLGGEPWSVAIPLRNLMVIGYDAFHSPNKRLPSVGAVVATTADTFGKYFSQTHFHKNRSELSANLCMAMRNALLAYLNINKILPARIILYRDGVGDGQLSYIYNTELDQIRLAIGDVYREAKVATPKFSFIIVTKRIHTRIFVPGSAGETNPGPGTIVDDVITLPERYDFFLVSQNVLEGTGTVSPTSYNVLVDEQGLNPDKMQRLTLKLCHLYYNYTGTIAVPAPCQYAHKLAYLTGQSLHTQAHHSLQNLLYFL